jgi:hypothetical protein
MSLEDVSGILPTEGPSCTEGAGEDAQVAGPFCKCESWTALSQDLFPTLGCEARAHSMHLTD